MKKFIKPICIIAAVCLLGTAAFCGYHIYDHYAQEAKQTEAFEAIADKVEGTQADEDAPEIPLTEEENILAEYGELFLQNPDMVGWIKIAGTTVNYPIMHYLMSRIIILNAALKRHTTIWERPIFKKTARLLYRRKLCYRVC